MDVNDMKGNECSRPDDGGERRFEAPEILDVSDAIRHLESMISDLERELSINR